MRRVVAALVLVCGWAGPSAAQNLDQRNTYIAYDAATLALMKARLDANNADAIPGNDVPLLQKDDIVGVILKATPGPGTSTGAGGYFTFYIPEGTQVVGAEYVQPDGAGGFTSRPLKGPAIMPLGDGPVGSTATPGLAGLVLGPNVLGLTEGSVDAAGDPKGTIAGVYGDTGIFYSVDPDTAWQSFATSGGYDGDTGTTGDNVVSNDLGESLVPVTKWDAEQLIAFGLSSPALPLIDANGRGNAPWGLANAVAGPESGYTWEFDWNTWQTNGNNLAGAIEVGPWNRIQYPGSQAASDQAGLKSSQLGYIGVDASGLGHDLSPANPLPPTIDWNDGSSPTALRFSSGGLELGRAEYGRVEFKILGDQGDPVTPFDGNGCFLLNTDAFSGDTGGENGGKDHLWRAYDPTTATVDACAHIQMVASNPVVATGEVFSYRIDVINLGNSPLTNVVVTDVLPAGLEFVNAVPAPNSTGPLVWNLGEMDPGDQVNDPIMQTITVTVRATGAGEIVNTVQLSSNEATALAEESIQAGAFPLLRPDMDVTPSTTGPGSTLTYTLTLNNLGSGPSGTVEITEFLPDGFTYTGIVSQSINRGVLPGGSLVVDASDPSTPVFSLSQAINPGDSLVLVFEVLVDGNQAVGTYENVFSYRHNGRVMSAGPLAPVTVNGGKIGDTVYRDWNGNGAQDIYDEGIAGVTVNLYADVDVDGNFEPGGDDGAPLDTLLTGADGDYVFVGLDAGAYFVEIDAAGVPANHTLTQDPGIPNGGPTDVSRVVLALNEENLAQDFGYEPNPGSGFIGNLVFDDTANDGIYDAGDDTGIGGVVVSLYEDSNADGVADPEDYLVGTAVTNGGGTYGFSNLPEGFDYVAVVDLLDPALVAYFAPIGILSTTGETQMVSGLSGADTSANFGFFSLVPSSIGDEVFADNNQDGVFNSGDAWLEDVTVTLYDDGNGDGLLDSGESAVRITETGPDGKYLFDLLGPGDYLVRVDAGAAAIPGGFLPSMQDIAINIPIPAGAGTDVTTADFPFVPGFSKSVDKTTAVPGVDDLTYSIDFTYPDDGLLNQVQVSDIVPAGTTFVSAGQGGVLGLDNTGTVTLGASKDARVHSGANSDTNYGASVGADQLRVRNDDRRVFLEFDLSSLPPGASIAGGRLRLNVWTAAPDDTVSIHAVTQPWTEGTGNGVVTGDGVTWNSRDGTNNWITPGGDYEPVAAASFSPNASGYREIDLSSLVAAWHADPASNHGIVLIGANGDQSRYWSLGTANPPQLEIDYTVGVSQALETVVWDLGSNVPGTPHESVPVTLTLYPDDDPLGVFSSDTYNKEGDPTGIFWNEGALKINGGSERQNGFLLFDLFPIPAGATVTSAVLTVNVESGRAGHIVDVAPVADFWLEAFLSWDNRNFLTPWAAPGGDFGSVVDSFDASNTGEVSVDIQALAQSWVDGAFNDGVGLIVRSGTGTDEIAITSVEGGGHASGPRLEVTYQLGANTTTEVAAGPSIVTDGSTYTVEMILTADEDASLDSLSYTLSEPSGVTLTPVSTPPAFGVVLAGLPTVLTWEFSVAVDSGVMLAPGQIGFTADAGGTTILTSEAVVWGPAEANTVIVTPPLTFTVSVDDPAPLGVVENTASMWDLGTLPPVDSNTVLTILSGSIGDTVYADLDGNGSQGAGEPGFEGVEVCATNGVVVRCDTTDANGNYRIFGLDLNGGNPWTVSLNPATLPAGYSLPTPATIDRTLGAPMEQIDDVDFGLLPPASNPASIGDIVWLDADEDGVKDAGESGLSGVTVVLYSDNNNNGVIDGLDQVVGGTVTGADGSYLFGGLYPGDYIVAVDEGSTVDTSQGGTTTVAAAMDLVSGTNVYEVPVTLSAGGSHGDADFGYNWSGSIGDLTYYDDDGDMVRDGGEPAAGEVSILLYEDLNGNGSIDGGDLPVGFAESSVSGAYLFDNLAPGNYLVSYDAATVESRDTPGLYGTMVPTTLGLRPVSLAAGEDHLDADAGFIELAYVEGYVFHDVDGNGFFDGGETPLQSVEVTLSGTETGGAPVSMVVDTNAAGRFSFFAPAGSYAVSYDVNDPDIPANLATQTTTSVYNLLAALGDEITGLNFGRDDAGAVGDTIYSDGNGNGNQNTADAGLAGVTVLLFPASGSTLLDLATTDAGGNYLFTGLADGNYRVVVVTASLPSGYDPVPTDDPEGNGDSEGSATVTAGGTDLLMDFGYEPTFNQSRVDGFVFEDTNQNGILDGVEVGLADVTVTVEVDEDRNGTVDLVFTATTAVDGEYRVRGIRDGSDVTITVDPTTLPSLAFVPTGDADSAAPNGDHVVALTNVTSNVNDQNFGYVEVFGSLSGTVVEGDGNGVADGGEPALVNVEVNLTFAGVDGILGTGDDTVQTEYTDATGDYTFTGLAPGLHEIEETDPAGYLSLADADGGNPGNIITTLASGEVKVDQDFEDAPRPTLAGRVIADIDLDGDWGESAGEPGIEGVTVELYLDANGDGIAQAGELADTTTSNSNGDYLFADLGYDDYLVQEIDPVGATSTADTGPDNGDDNLIPVTLSFAGGDSAGNDFLDVIDHTGYAYDSATGEIIAGGTISVVQDSGTPATIRIAETGVSGRYAFSVDQAGTFTLSYSPPARYVVDPARSVFGSSYDADPGPGTDLLGTGEDPGNAGYLTDPGAVANPYFLTFVLNPGDQLVIHNNIPLVKLKATNFNDYLTDAGLTPGTAEGQVFPDGSGNGGNPDGDFRSNLLEHALCDTPVGGVPNHDGFSVQLVDAATGRIDATFVRGEAIQDVIYTLQGKDDLKGIWVDIASIAAGAAAAPPFTVVSNGDETETVTYADLGNAGAAGLTPAFGLVRLRVSLDSEPDGIADTVTLPSDGSSVTATDATKTFGWQGTNFNAGQCGTYGVPFAPKPVFTGTIDANLGAAITVITSGQGLDLGSVIAGGGTHYLQLTSGAHEGERFDIASAGVDLLTLVGDPDIFSKGDGIESLNTSDGLPADAVLNGARFQVLPHRTIDELFDKNGSFAGLASGFPSQAAKLFLYENRGGTPSLDTYLLVDTGFEVKWVRSNDFATLTDQGSKRIDRTEGAYIHPMLGGLTQTSVGVVADYDLAVALNEGYNFTGAPYPLLQAPADADPGPAVEGRDWQVSTGLVGGVTPTSSAQLAFWNGDLAVDEAATYATGYSSLMLLDGGGMQRWINANDPLLNDLGADLMLKSHRAVMIKLRTGNTLKPHRYPEPSP